MTEIGNPDWKVEQDKFWPKFTVQCDVCGSHKISLENTMGYSAESGGWGEISFQCNDCGNVTHIVES